MYIVLLFKKQKYNTTESLQSDGRAWLPQSPAMVILWGEHLRRWRSPSIELGKKHVLSPDPGEESCRWQRVMCLCPLSWEGPNLTLPCRQPASKAIKWRAPWTQSRIKEGDEGSDNPVIGTKGCWVWSEFQILIQIKKKKSTWNVTISHQTTKEKD